MNKEPQQPEREERIAAYVNGEMTADQAAAFEQLMESDEVLRQEVDECRRALDAARAWMTQEAPGVDRVDALEIPRLVMPRGKVQEVYPRHAAEVPVKSKHLSFLRYAMAAAAIFLIGFLLGTQWPLAFRPGAPEISITKGSETPKEPYLATPSPVPPSETAESRLADLGARRSVTRQNGRVIVETTLKDTNVRALWVVDAGFRLPQSSTQQ